jgi:4-diphosphocytidyl-2-C-methyl-D-erythritol kinase
MPINSYAKINLFLKIGKKLSSGYHKIQSVMQQIDLNDNITVDLIDEPSVILECNNKELENKDNLAYKSAMLLRHKYKIEQGVRISIEKNIPIEAGLGGGSSNAGVVLSTLNKLYKLKLSEGQLGEIALGIGSDVPFFIGEGAAVVEGVGEKVKRIKKYFSINIVLIHPGFRVLTKWAYSAFDRQASKPRTSSDIEALIRSIEKKDIKVIANNLHNDFEPVLMKKYKIIAEIKTNLVKNGALNACVSGSGPTVFGIFNSIYEAREAFFKIQYDYPFVYLTKTI